MDLVMFFIVVIVGILAGIPGAIAGGGSAFITIPIFLFLGLPISSAIATSKFSAIGSAASTIYNYFKANKIIMKLVIPLAMLNLLGAYIGANFLVNANEETLSKVIGTILLLLIPLTIFGDKGIKKKKIKKNYMILGFILYFLITIYSAFFGAGAGLIIVFVLINFFGLTYIQSNATLRIPWLINIIVSLLIFGYYGLINYSIGIAFLIGRFIGGFIGSKIAIKKGNKFVKWVFVAFIIITSIKIWFF